MPPLRTALLQSSGHPGETARNLEVLDAAAGRAAAAGAGLLIAPELFLTGYAIGDGVRRLAEPADGPGGRAVARIAATHGVAVLYGYPERAGHAGDTGAAAGEPGDARVPGAAAHAGGAVFNSARLVGPDGAQLANYRKTHLFGDFERAWFTPGDTPVVQAELGGVRLGIMICYDVEFPENVRAHALAGTDLLLVPTAQMHPFQFVAETLVPVRAFESQLYIAYVNRTGPEGDFDFIGLSCLAGPDGTVKTRAGRGEELAFGEVDAELLAASRTANPYLGDRRPELYTLT